VHIGLIAPPWVPVPPIVYGGTELVVDQLARGLTAAGCEVTLFTTGDSTCPVRRRWLYPKALGIIENPEAELRHVEAAYQALDGVDVIHDHSLLGPIWAATHDLAPAVLCTVHGAMLPSVRAQLVRASARVGIVAISHSQRRSAPEVPVAAVIHHGLDPDAFPVGAGLGGYVLFLGRMSPDKGVDRAVRIARAAGKPIVIAAKMWEPGERTYFEERVRPLLGEHAEYLGEVGGDAKLRLLGDAEALVNPICWPEPFGLVMIEALACGTPVLAFPAGAAPEIVDHGRTGFLCPDERDMARRLGEVPSLDRLTCRVSVERSFSTTRMVDDHLALYERAVARDRHNAAS
jgi:glycosyltransferase involved in cell wall biosynthesis